MAERMIIEVKIRLKNEDGSKKLEKKLEPIHHEISLSQEDPTIKALIDSAMNEFGAPIDDLVVTCRMTL
jgi:hypothetical protein